MRSLENSVLVVVPCYRSSGLVKNVVNEILDVANIKKNSFPIDILIVDDACPEESWKEIPPQKNIKIIHHKFNKGVGAAFQSGIEYALKNNYEIYVKLDSDGQHSPAYLNELIPYALSLPINKLTLIKGSRYSLLINPNKSPLVRRIGSLFMEPIARAAISYRGLTDVANGYLIMNKLTAEYLFSKHINPPLKSRYLFESSLLERCSCLSCEIHQFDMVAKYGDKWRTSMLGIKMIFPIIFFWFNSTYKRLVRKYIKSLNLGSLLLMMVFISFSISLNIFNSKIIPRISVGNDAGASSSTILVSSLIFSLLSLLIFFLYDYNSGQIVKDIRLKSFIEDLKIY